VVSGYKRREVAFLVTFPTVNKTKMNKKMSDHRNGTADRPILTKEVQAAFKIVREYYSQCIQFNLSKRFQTTTKFNAVTRTEEMNGYVEHLLLQRVMQRYEDSAMLFNL
jgi:hypothetical protein